MGSCPRGLGCWLLGKEPSQNHHSIMEAPSPQGQGALSYLQELLVIQPTQHQFMAQFHHLCWNTRVQLPQTVTQTGGRQAPWPSAKGFPAKGGQQGGRWRTPWGASMASCCVTYTWSLPFSGG